MSLPDIQFEFLTHTLRAALEEFPDERKGMNKQYSMMDAASGAFSVFFTQCPSFLSYQQMLKERHGLSNAQTLFGMKDIPTDTHIRTLLDTVPPKALTSVFTTCFNRLEKQGYLSSFRTTIGDHDYLMALDGTQYFSSGTIHCDLCSTKKKNGEITYCHGMINPALVAPGKKEAIALPPEFIVPQDGDSKQDSELKASKRWISANARAYAPLGATILGDDLYAHEPFCRNLLAAGFNFILVCKPDSHKTVYEWVKGITKKKVEDRFDGKKHLIYTYNYVEAVPLRDEKDPLLVNFVEVTVNDRTTGKQVYHNAFITNHPLTEQTVPLIVDCGRARWKIENENNNTLKRQGYNLEHNYGHGGKYLSSLLATMNILAFLFHTILDMTDQTYQLLRRIAGSRVRFFEEMRSMLKFFPCRSFHTLMLFMLDCLEHPRDPSTVKVPI